MSVPFSPSVDLPQDTQDILARFIEQIHQQWSADLDGLVLFGSAARGDFITGRSNLNILLVVRNLSVDLLRRAGQLHRQWGPQKIIAPLVMMEDDLQRSRYLFPLECLQMTQHHVVLAGRDPFSETPVDPARLSWQCEHELMANLLHVRQRFIEGEGRIEAIQALLILSITSVLPCVRGLLHCLGQPSLEKDLTLLKTLPTTIQFDPTTFLDMLKMKRGLSSPGSLEWPKAYARYLQSLELFLERVQQLRQEGRL